MDGRKLQVYIKLIHFSVGARKYAILMSVLAICKKRDENFMETVEEALRSEVTSEN